MKVILMHGMNTSLTEKWYPWFIDEMQTKGVEMSALALPAADNPVISEWLQELENTTPDEETVLVGHSRGGVAIMRWLEQAPADLKVKKVILIATNSGLFNHMAIPSESNHGFYTDSGYDFEKIKTHCDSFTLFHSKDDKWVPYSNGLENADGLAPVSKLISFDDMGHFYEGVDVVSGLIDLVLGA